MNPGTQIAYIPTHARAKEAGGDILHHPDVQFGFVTSEQPTQQAHFCRYWRRDAIGKLRTTANSELTPNDCLIEVESVPQEHVERVWCAIQAERYHEIEDLDGSDDL